MGKILALSKQDYILQRLMCEDITVSPSGHVQKSICQHLIKLTDKLRRLERIGQDSDVMENITYLVELIAKIKD